MIWNMCAIKCDKWDDKSQKFLFLQIIYFQLWGYFHFNIDGFVDNHLPSFPIHVVETMKGIKETNRIKKKIRVGSVMTENVGDMD